MNEHIGELVISGTIIAMVVTLGLLFDGCQRRTHQFSMACVTSGGTLLHNGPTPICVQGGKAVLP